MIKQYLTSLIENSYNQNSKNILSLLERKKNSYLLDLGCDDGNWTLQLAKKIQTKNIYGVEVVPERIKIAKKNGLKIFKADLNTTLPIKNNFFDVVHANQVIEHLYDTDMFVHEISRILKPNGYAVISTENLSSWHNIFALSLGFQPFSSTNLSIKGNIGNPFALWKDKESANSNLKSWQHNRLFSYFALKDLFQKYNFKVEKIITSGYYPVWGKISRIDPIHGHWIAVKIRKTG